ncbi:hypothetical protein [Paramylibacter kogurei]|nr:hypothetical protein [Amylibacter kogurei]
MIAKYRIFSPYCFSDTICARLGHIGIGGFGMLAKILFKLFLFSTVATMVQAQEGGIDFSAMKIGTKLTTRTVWTPQSTFVAEYIGAKDGFHLIQNYKVKDGSLEENILDAYDDQGRRVWSTRNGHTNRFTPYSCHFVIGECNHQYEYYNVLTKKMVTNQSRYFNRREGDVFYLGIYRSDGSLHEVAHQLGAYNLRLSNVHQNALGQDSGFEFIELTVPE